MTARSILCALWGTLGQTHPTRDVTGECTKMPNEINRASCQPIDAGRAGNARHGKLIRRATSAQYLAHWHISIGNGVLDGGLVGLLGNVRQMGLLMQVSVKPAQAQKIEHQARKGRAQKRQQTSFLPARLKPDILVLILVR